MKIEKATIHLHKDTARYKRMRAKRVDIIDSAASNDTFGQRSA